MTAAVNGSIKCMQLLIDSNADVMVTDDDNRNIIHCIVINQDLDQVKVRCIYLAYKVQAGFTAVVSCYAKKV